MRFLKESLLSVFVASVVVWLYFLALIAALFTARGLLLIMRGVRPYAISESQQT